MSEETAVEETPAEETATTTETETTETATETTETTKEFDWGAYKESIKDENVRKQAERFTDPEAAVKSTLELRQKLSKAGKPPGKNASEDEVIEYRKTIGVPETADAYELPGLEKGKTDEQQKEYLKSWQDVFHKNNVSQDVAKELSAHAIEAGKQAMKAVEDKDEQFAKETDEELRSTWKGEYDKNVTFANRASDAVFSDDFEDFKELTTKDDKLVVNHPLFIKAFAKLGREMGEGTLGPVISGTEKESLQDQADVAREKRNEAHAKGNNREAMKWDQKERDLLARIHGSGGVVGVKGKTF